MLQLEIDKKLISPIDTIKILLDIFIGDKEYLTLFNNSNEINLYLKRLITNDYFLYYIALQQNYRENIILQLYILLSNKYIEDNDIVKKIKENQIYINEIPKLIDIQLEFIWKSKFRYFYDQNSFIEWKKWLIKEKDSIELLKECISKTIPIIDKYIDLYKNIKKQRLCKIDSNYYLYCSEINTTLPICKIIKLDVLLDFAYKEQQKLETMIRNICKKKKFILGDSSLKHMIRYLKNQPKYKFSSKENFLSEYQKELDILNDLYKNKLGFKFDKKCNLINYENDYFHGIYFEDTFFINGSEWMNELNITTKDLVAHETAPGHHLQISLDKNNSNNDNLNIYYFPVFGNGSCEGWALFSEKLIPNITEDDLLGILFANMHRTIRIIADIMIHYYGKSTNSVYKLYKSNTLMSNKQIESEIKRLKLMPGQALCYKLGDQVFRKIFIHKLSKKEPLFTCQSIELYKNLLYNGIIPLEILINKYGLDMNELFNII